jgi:hypothetical protein
LHSTTGLCVKEDSPHQKKPTNMVYVPRIRFRKTNIAPSDLDKHKTSATGEEWWATEFVYPNGWSMDSFRKAYLIKGYERNRWPILIFWEYNPKKFVLYLILCILFYYLWRLLA